MRRAIVTGSNGGIGTAICKDLQNHGIEVIGFVRKASGTSPWPEIACDLSDPDSIKSAFDNFEKKHGVADILINNAGVYHAKAWDQLSVEDFMLSMNVNVHAPFLMAKHFADRLISSGQAGAIVTVGSISGQIGSIDPSYAASKGSLPALTKSLAKAFAPHNIRVNNIAPGPVETKMGDSIPEDRKKSYKEAIPLKRFAEAEEIAKLVSFLVSDESSYVTGATFNIDGGLT